MEEIILEDITIDEIPPIEDLPPIDEEFPTPMVCTCSKCDECRQLELALIEGECTCTYKDITHVDEEGNEYITKELDVKCAYCIAKDVVNTKYDNYRLLEKANIDITLWDKCSVVDGVIYTPHHDDSQTYDSIKRFAETYKWEKAEWFIYDGSMQKNASNDILMMIQSREALELKIMEYIEWKYPDRRVMITDPNYFIQMQLMSAQMIQLCFATEKHMLDLVSAMTPEEITRVEPKKLFDDVFDELLAKATKK